MVFSKWTFKVHHGVLPSLMYTTTKTYLLKGNKKFCRSCRYKSIYDIPSQNQPGVWCNINYNYNTIIWQVKQKISKLLIKLQISTKINNIVPTKFLDFKCLFFLRCYFCCLVFQICCSIKVTDSAKTISMVNIFCVCIYFTYM